MRYFLIIAFVLLGFSGQTFAQYQPTVAKLHGKVVSVDSMPRPAYNVQPIIQKNIKYPVQAVRENVQGRVYVEFLVDTNGRIDSLTVPQSIHPALDQEAMRVVKLFPPWKPGLINGKPVPLRITFPVVFRIAQ